MKKIFISLVLFIALLSLVGCGSDSSSGEEKKEIKVGATAGPYSDQLKESIIPILEKDGYTVEIIEFNDYIQPNKALDEGDINVNVFQNDIYLDEFNEAHGMDLVSQYAVPTAPIGLYSEEHQSLDDIGEGMKITLPNDPTNLARALHMLVDFGWITINPDVEQATASEKDVLTNEFDLDIQPIEAAQTVRSLDDTDFAFVNGNFAIASGLELTSAVATEQTTEGYLNYLVLREGDEDEDFAKALEEAYHSQEFLDYTNEHAEGFVKPPYQVELEESN